MFSRKLEDHLPPKLLVKEVVPFFGVPEADRGTNLLSHLMMAVCASGGEKVGHNRLPPPV